MEGCVQPCSRRVMESERAGDEGWCLGVWMFGGCQEWNDGFVISGVLYAEPLRQRQGVTGFWCANCANMPTFRLSPGPLSCIIHRIASHRTPAQCCCQARLWAIQSAQDGVKISERGKHLTNCKYPTYSWDLVPGIARHGGARWTGNKLGPAWIY